MKRLGLAGGAILALGALIVGGSLGLRGEPPNKRQDLAAMIVAAVESASVGQTIVLEDVVPLDFDFVVIVTPYADNPAVAEVVGLPWDAEAAAAYRSEASVELVFVDDGRITAWCQVARSSVDFPVLRGPFAVDAPADFRVTAAVEPFGKGLRPPP
jgi:hypothetical protein